MKYVSGVMIALVLGLMGYGLANAETGVTDKEIIIGSCMSRETDKAKFVKHMSQAAYEGAASYFNYLNEHGGINGRKVKYITRDDNSDPEKCIECFNELMSDGMFAFGANLGGAIPTGKYLRLAQSNQVPAFGFHANLDEIYEPVKPFVFGAGVPWSKSLEITVDKLWNDAGKRKFAYIYSNDLFGAANLEYLQNAMKKHGSTLVAYESFPRNTPTQVMEQVKKVAAAKPEVVLLGGTPPSGMAVLKAAKEIGFKAIFVHGTGARGFEYPKLIGDAAEGFIFPANAPSPLEENTPTAKIFKAQLKKDFPESQPEVMRLAEFVDMMVLAEGLKRAGKDLTREKFVKAMESIKDFDTGLGPDYKVSFSPTDHQAFDTVPFFIVKNGQAVSLKNWKSLK